MQLWLEFQCAAKHRHFIMVSLKQFQGKLLRIKSLHPNQEAFGGHQIAVTLDQQINVDGRDGLVKTKLIQLVDFKNTRYQSFFKNEGKQVQIKCEELFRRHTAHHTTKVLCIVDSVSYK